MRDNCGPTDKEQWVIWNGSSGLVAMATIGQVNVVDGRRNAWLDHPFDMVGPVDLDELEASGRIAFAACMVMSRQRWREDQSMLRQYSHERRRAAQERLRKKQARFNNGRRGQRNNTEHLDEKQLRETLSLPVDGRLEPSQIKAAYRRLAQRAHPDVGGSHEQFLRITEARNALLECIS
jgi:hypothetical protein